ncbi:MAG: heavy metal translocating P-type ATPase [Myxococcota bacterium]
MTALAAERYRVEGMRCAGCASRIEGLLRAVPGVDAAEVSFAAGSARVAGEAADEALAAALEDAGYALHPADTAHPTDLRAEAAREGRRAAWSAALTLPLFALAMAAPDTPANRAAQLALALPVVFGCGAVFHRGAWRRARHATADMDTLISLGTLAALLASALAWQRGAPLFFETAAMIVTFVCFGRWLELRARARASDAVSGLAALLPDRARVWRDGDEVEVALDALRVGDVLVLRPGDRVPADACVLEGRGSFDESQFTGEAIPVTRDEGDPLRAGTRNADGFLRARLESLGEDTRLAAVARLVEDTQASRAPIQAWVDRVAAIFVPGVLAVAALTFAVWAWLGAEGAALWGPAIAVLVVACPCALGLATPTAIAAGSGRGAELGVLFRTADAFERAGQIDAIAFDKTGTLTEGRPELLGIFGTPKPDVLLGQAAAVETGSEHPLGRALVSAAHDRGLALPTARNFEARVGDGAEAEVEDRSIRVGSLSWLAASGASPNAEQQAAVDAADADGDTCIGVAIDGVLAGVFVLQDPLRSGVRETLARLRDAGHALALWSGDREAPVRRVADALGITRIGWRLSPDDKAEDVARWQAEGRRVAFVGDGINDAAALARADLGLAIGTGTDLARDSGDAVLVSGDPSRVAVTLELAARTRRTIRQNLVWAFGYNLAALPIAAAGGLSPMLAAAAMAASSVCVVSNSLRLRRTRLAGALPLESVAR